MTKAYRLKTKEDGIPAGTIVYEYNGNHFGILGDDYRATGRRVVAVTKVADQLPFITIFEDNLEEIGDTINLEPVCDPDRLEVIPASADFPTPKVHYETEPSRNSPHWNAWAKRFIDKIRTCATPTSAAGEIVDTFVDVSRQLSAVEAELKPYKIVHRHNQELFADMQRQLELAKKLLAQVDEKVFCIEDFTIEKRRSDGKWIVTADDHKPYFGSIAQEFKSPFEALVATDALKREWQASNETNAI